MWWWYEPCEGQILMLICLAVQRTWEHRHGVSDNPGHIYLEIYMDSVSSITLMILLNQGFMDEGSVQASV